MVKCSRKSVSLSDLWVSSDEKLSDFFVSSWQRGESPVPLLVVRLALATLAVGIFVWSLSSGASPYWLIYLTNWGLLLVVLTTLSSLLVSFIALCNKLPDVGELPWYVSMYWIFYNIGVPVAVMITALYWILLYDPDPPEGEPQPDFWLDLATHGFNSCIAVAEVLISRTPVRFLHVYQPLGVGLWYAAFSGIYYAAGGTDREGNPFIYDILDWRQARHAGIIVAISAAGLIMLYTLLWGFALCRDKVSAAFVRTISHDLPSTPPDPHMHRIV
ncbi:protein rolling stone-like [Epargyreus clarus]|uniref:protein rolling stone-like n=1 Tax=Epargyreus clarus TaxID=520877 RepID=UPI003C2B44F8